MRAQADTMRLDREVLMMLDLYTRGEAEEPQEPNGNMPASMQEEAARKHDEWDRYQSALALMLSRRLLRLLLDQA